MAKKIGYYISKDCDKSVLLRQLTETSRRNPVLSAKKFSEITYVIKSALFADTGKAVRCVSQHKSRLGKAVLIQVFPRGLGQKSTKTAEAFPFAYLPRPGDLLHHDRFGIMLVDVIQHPAHPFRLKRCSL